jgi:predicted dinucleotide-binding enzyme
MRLVSRDDRRKTIGGKGDHMTIGILGTGMVGQSLAGKLIALGHTVIIGTRDASATLANETPNQYGVPPFSAWHKQHQAVKVESFAEAAAQGDLLVNCTAGTATLEVLKMAGEKNLGNKILIDVSNPLDFSKGMPPTLTVSNTDSLAEQIQRSFPNVKVVKTLNTTNTAVMVDPSLVPGDHDLFLSGNDEKAKSTVMNLLVSLGWKKANVIDLGDITTARGTEQLLPLWVRLYRIYKSPLFNFHVVVAPSQNR